MCGIRNTVFLKRAILQLQMKHGIVYVLIFLLFLPTKSTWTTHDSIVNYYITWYLATHFPWIFFFISNTWHSHLTSSLITSMSVSNHLPPILDIHVISATSLPSQQEEGMRSSLLSPISCLASHFLTEAHARQIGTENCRLCTRINSQNSLSDFSQPVFC